MPNLNLAVLLFTIVQLIEDMWLIKFVLGHSVMVADNGCSPRSVPHYNVV